MTGPSAGHDDPMTEPAPTTPDPGDDRDVIDAERDVIDPDEFPPADDQPGE